MMMRTIFSLALVFSLYQAFGQNCNSVRYLDEVFEEVTITTGIKFAEADPYGIIGSQDLLLDLYMPTGDALEKRPLIIYAFGGGFLIGTRFQPPIPQFCEHFARLGYVVAAIDYRIGFNTTSSGSAERAVYRGVQDLRAAMRFLGQFSAGYGIDTTTIFLTGSSAGCFSALHSTFMEDSDRPQSSFGILLEPSDLSCADCSGNSYLNNNELRPKGIINNWGAMLDTLFIDPIAKDNVPVISFHGTDDLIVPYNTGSPFSYPIFPSVHGSAPIHQRLDNLGITNQLISLEGIGHEPWLLDAALLDTVYNYSVPFLHELMRPQTSTIAGDAIVPVGDVRSYSVTGQTDSQFCWEVTGGIIIADNGTTVDVLWNQTGAWELSVVEVSCIEVLGLPQSLEVEVSSPTGVHQRPDATSVTVYPNPTNEFLFVNGLDDRQKSISIRVNDLAGRTLIVGKIQNDAGMFALDVRGLAKGIYTLVVDVFERPVQLNFVKIE